MGLAGYGLFKDFGEELGTNQGDEEKKKVPELQEGHGKV